MHVNVWWFSVSIFFGILLNRVNSQAMYISYMGCPLPASVIMLKLCAAKYLTAWTDCCFTTWIWKLGNWAKWWSLVGSWWSLIQRPLWTASTSQFLRSSHAEARSPWTRLGKHWSCSYVQISFALYSFRIEPTNSSPLPSGHVSSS